MLIIRAISDRNRLATWQCDVCGKRTEVKVRGDEQAQPPLGWPAVFGHGLPQQALALACSTTCADAFTDAYKDRPWSSVAEHRY